mmetsp:Transcript_20312/g.48379  ORF Transcript_20312/g.48379 Transcript_20312/m.48379 type:complete len:255 (+) Transcript_20312:655-1419(+)
MPARPPRPRARRPSPSRLMGQTERARGVQQERRTGARSRPQPAAELKRMPRHRGPGRAWAGAAGWAQAPAPFPRGLGLIPPCCWDPEMPAGASLLEEGVMARGGVAFPVGCGEAAGAAGAAGAAAAAALLACCSLPDCWAAWEEAGAEDWRKKGFSWTESSLDGVVGSPRAWFLRAAAAWRSRSLFRSASFSDSFSFSFSFSLSDFFSFSFFSGTSGGADTGSRIVALSSWSISTSYRSSGLPNSSKPSWLRST